jgi:hypothetical protein
LAVSRLWFSLRQVDILVRVQSRQEYASLSLADDRFPKASSCLDSLQVLHILRPVVKGLSPYRPHYSTYLMPAHQPSRRALFTLISRIVWSVSLADQETSRQTVHADLVVTLEPVRLAQPASGQINRIARTYRIFGSPKRVRSSLCLNFGNSIFADFVNDTTS